MKTATAVTTVITILLSVTFAVAESPRVCVLISSDIKPYSVAAENMKSTIAHMYSEAKINTHIVADAGEIKRLISQEKPSLIFTVGPQATKAVIENIANTSIVFCMVFQSDYLKNANASGVILDIPAAVKIEYIRQILKEKQALSVVYSPVSQKHVDSLVTVCRETDLKLSPVVVKSDRELPQVLTLISSRNDCLVMVPDSTIYFAKSIEYLILESLRRKFPVIGLSSGYTKAGALMSLDYDYKDIGKQAGEMAIRVIGKEGSIVNESPRSVILSVNIATAARLGIRFSRSFLNRVDEKFGEE